MNETAIEKKNVSFTAILNLIMRLIFDSAGMQNPDQTYPANNE